MEKEQEERKQGTLGEEEGHQWGEGSDWWENGSELPLHPSQVLRSKGLKDATCVGWFGDDWDCSVGSPPEAIDHVSSTVPVGYAV